jgi:hypothetical protein
MRKDDDTVIVLFSGHGKKEEEGFIPYVDDDIVGALIEYNTIKKYLKDINCLHLILIFDCCYAGASLPKESPPSGHSEASQAAWQRKSRIVLTSGYYETVPDEEIEGGEHSPFASAIIKVLKDGDRIGFDTFYGRVKDRTYENGGGSVERAYFNGHEFGEFVFLPAYDGRPPVGKLKDEIINKLNFHKQVDIFKKYKNDGRHPGKINFVYISGTKRCAHHLFLNRFAKEYMGNQDIMINRNKMGPTESGIMDISGLINGKKLDQYILEIIDKTKSYHLLSYIFLENDINKGKFFDKIYDLWSNMNSIIENNYDKEENIKNNKYKYYLFIIEIEDRENGFEDSKNISDLNNKFNYNRDFYNGTVCFFNLEDIEQLTYDQVYGWWDDARSRLSAAKFDRIEIRAFSEKNYLQEVIERICKECDRSELFDELFIKNSDNCILY